MTTNIREKIQSDVFSKSDLMTALKDTPNIKDEIHGLLYDGTIIELTKTLYAFSYQLQRKLIKLETVAAKLYTPSYISSDFALAYYGLIPETVYAVTSITKRKNREFHTPLGAFYYMQRRGADYDVGVQLIDTADGSFNIAYPEKALYDKIATDGRFDGTGIEPYLWKDLRLDEEGVLEFSIDRLTKLDYYATGKMKKLTQYLIKNRRRNNKSGL